MKLGAFFHPTGHHVAAWLHPGAQIDAGTNFPHYVELARTAEAALFDFVFLADTLSVRDGRLEALSRWPQYMVFFEPLTLLSAIAALTSRIGLVATASVNYAAPYDLARKFASLDHISGGRAGWNVVTSSSSSVAANYGQDRGGPHDVIYARATECVTVVKGLWDSWADDAFLRDRATHRYFDPSKLHVLDHQGPEFRVRGPLNIARPPQGHPLLVTAGGSAPARALAAAHVDAMFTPLHSLDAATAFYADVKSRMANQGRDPDALKIMPGLNPVIGDTPADAEERHRYLQSLVHPDVGIELLSDALGADVSGMALDAALPDDFETRHPARVQQTHRNTVLGWARKEKLTVRELYQRFAGARGQRTVIGTAEHIANEMQAWFEGRGVDGYLIQPPYLPGGLDDFVTKVIPILQERGLYRSAYEGATLRHSLGLERPRNSHMRGEVEQG